MKKKTFKLLFLKNEIIYKSINSLNASTCHTFSGKSSNVSSKWVTRNDQTVEVNQERVLVQEVDETSNNGSNFWNAISGRHVVDSERFLFKKDDKI